MSKKKPHSKLWIYFTCVVFSTIFAVFLFISVLWLILFRMNVISIDPHIRHIPIVLFLFGSLLLGCILALFVGKLMIRPIQNISDAFDALSKGDFSVKVSEREKLAEIREMCERFNAMTFDLSHIETLRNDFVVNVSHEFKTPIASIEGYATLLQNHNLTPEKKEHYVEKIIDNSRRLSNLSSHILMLSKLENQETVMHKKEYRLDEQIRRVILMLESKWSPKKIEFDMELPKELYYGSEPLLEQVWNNLLDNAIKHSPTNGLICVGMEKSESHLSVTISDQGDGMEAEIQKHIFEKFYQGDSSRKAEGNGLGLALVKRIVDLCKGSITVKSEPNQGAAFTIKLPLEKPT
ncbi:MAG: ATP-binding protein [Lachnospiraceae bacterium]